MNCAFVSPSSRLLSNSATTSCGKRALSCCDLLLVELVAITGSPRVRCDSVYAKNDNKSLKCDSLKGSFKIKGAIHLVSAKPDSAATLTGLLTNPLNEVTKMAKQKCTQLFAAINRSQRNARPVMLRITADNERSARRRLTRTMYWALPGAFPAEVNMRNYPHPGERWQHERGWTVTIIRLIEASPSVALVNPEFSCEVLIRHDSDNQLSSCPLAWFEQRYTRLFDVPLLKPAPAPAGGSGSGPLTCIRLCYLSAGGSVPYGVLLSLTTVTIQSFSDKIPLKTGNHDEYFKRAQRCSGPHFAWKHNTGAFAYGLSEDGFGKLTRARNACDMLQLLFFWIPVSGRALDAGCAHGVAALMGTCGQIWRILHTAAHWLKGARWTSRRFPFFPAEMTALYRRAIASAWRRKCWTKLAVISMVRTAWRWSVLKWPLRCISSAYWWLTGTAKHRAPLPRWHCWLTCWSRHCWPRRRYWPRAAVKWWRSTAGRPLMTCGTGVTLYQGKYDNTTVARRFPAAAYGKWPVILQMLRIDVPENGRHGPCRNVRARIVFALMTLTGAGRGSAASVAMVTVWIWLSS